MVEMKKKKELCIVHIGMHKTGSSSIQSYLFNYLRSQEYYYPNLGSSNQSAVIFTLFSENPENYHSYRSRGLSKEDVVNLCEQNRAQLVHEITNSLQEKIILSGEDIINLSEDGIKKLKLFLDIYFNRIVIIGYVRPVHSYIQSAFQELVKHGLNSFSLENADPKYERFLNFYKVFEKQNIQLVPFVKSVLNNGDIVADFCSRFGIQLLTFEKINDNESLSKEAIAVLYTYQKYILNPYTIGRNYFLERDLVVAEIKNIGGTKFSFSHELTSKQIERNHNVIEELIELDKNQNYVLQILLEEDMVDTDKSIKNENDLLDCAASKMDKIIQIIGKNVLMKSAYQEKPEEIAKLMSVLKIKLVSNYKLSKNENLQQIFLKSGVGKLNDLSILESVESQKNLFPEEITFVKNLKKIVTSRNANLAKPWINRINFISLGENCFPKTLLVRWGIQKTRENGNKLLPFDLAETPGDSLGTILSTDFKTFLDDKQLEYDDISSFYRHKNYKIGFNHDLDIKKNEVMLLQKRYLARIENFYNLLDADTPIFFIYAAFTSSFNDFNHLVKILKDKHKNSYLIILNLNQSVENTVLNENISIVNVNLPKYYIWHRHEFYASDIGFAFEQSIIEKIFNIVKSKMGILSYEREYQLIKKFNIDWTNYIIVHKLDGSKIDPLDHYVKNWKTLNLVIEGFFDASFYLEKYLDVKLAGINPLLHYLIHGKNEKRLGWPE